MYQISSGLFHGCLELFYPWLSKAALLLKPTNKSSNIPQGPDRRVQDMLQCQQQETSRRWLASLYNKTT